MDSFKVIGGLLFVVYVAEAAKWTYDRDSEKGPANWGGVAELCDDIMQSPIDVVHDEAIAVSWDPFEFIGYDPKEENHVGSVISIRNTGHTAMMELDGFHSMSGGGLPTEYEALQAHFHWGKSDAVGSEHTIDGKQFPLEMHIVHYAYIPFNGSVVEAVFSEDNEALAVLGVLFEIGEEDNENFEEIMKGVREITADGETYTFQDPVYLLNLLPKNISKYYRYNGSLTTPDCFQVVTWTVFTDTVSISSSQVAEFRNLLEGAGDDAHLIGDAYRPVQEVNSRDVFYNSALSNTATSLALMFAALTIFLF